MESVLCTVWHQPLFASEKRAKSRRKPCISSAAGCILVILSLSKFCEREASKTEEQSDEGISPVNPLGIKKTNVKSACRAASIRPRSDRERSPFGFRLRAPPSAQDDSGRCVPCRINQTNSKYDILTIIIYIFAQISHFSPTSPLLSICRFIL